MAHRTVDAGGLPRTRRTQAERTATMQKRLLDATVEALVESGYAGTTTLEVQKRAAVSRGALLHHYTSRSELMLAAIQHLCRTRLAELRDREVDPPTGAKRLGWAVGELWSSFEGPLFAASLELWMAARSDVELRAALVPQERQVGDAISAWAAEIFGPVHAAHPRFRATLAVLLDAMRGAAARAVLRGPDSDARLLREWTRLAQEQLSR
jgi:AcrR family transcriptional regulator